MDGTTLVLGGGRAQALPLEQPLRSLLGRDGRALAEAHLRCCPAHRPTPMVELPGLARSLGLAGLDVKDEGARLGLGSFKALGGAYAAIRFVLEEAGRRWDRAFRPSESGCAGLAGLMTAVGDPALRAALALEASFRVLLFNTESALAPARADSLPAQIRTA